MGRPKGKTNDDVYEHCVKVDEGVKNSRLKLQCKYCLNAYWGGTTRMKHHLGGTRDNVAPCTKVPDDIQSYFKEKLIQFYKKRDKDDDILDIVGDDVDDAQMPKKKKFMQGAFLKSSMVKQKTTLNTMLKKKDNVKVVESIARCLYANALPFNLVRSPYFKSMLDEVAEFGPGYKLPSYDDVREKLLKNEVLNVEGVLEKYKKDWARFGCTLMSDGWTDNKARSITNFLVNSPMGTVFLRSVDTSSISHSADNLCDLLDDVVQEIGEENVVQVVTDSASAYVKAGEMLMDRRNRLFWSPCAAHCIDLILSDIGSLLSTHADTVKKARQITVYMYRHAWVLACMRRYTSGRDLVRAGVTRFATCYLTLKSLHKNKIALRAMFGSEEWQRSQYAKRADAVEVTHIVLGDDLFWAAVKYCLNCVVPIVKVLRLVDGDLKPAIGYIYEAMDRAKEQIKNNFHGVKRSYEPVWNIIDKRWNLQLHRPLHAAAYFLNPRFQYDPEFNADMEVKSGLYQTIQRMCPDPLVRAKIDRQLDAFKNSEGMFGVEMAILMRKKKQPALWWESYGDSCKELQQLAIRILSLTCSATGCERNWSTFDLVHSKRRNRLEQKRLDYLVFVKYNLSLEARRLKRVEKGESYDPIELEDLESDEEWITEKEDPALPEDQAWLTINDVFDTRPDTSVQKKRRGPRDTSYKDPKAKKAKATAKGKGKQILVEESEEEFDDEEEDTEEEIEVVAQQAKKKKKKNVDDDDDDQFDDDLDEDSDFEVDFMPNED